jgi:diguanylate cyclase (GGDEF)-like protein/PAS domain S-box-containing protein
VHDSAHPDAVVERLAAYAERTPDLVGVTDDRGNVVYLNAAARRRWGLAGDEVAGLTTADLFPEPAFDVYFEQVRPALLRGEVWTGYLPVRGEGGEPVEMWVTIVGEVLAGGEVSWLVTTARDVTEWRHIRDELNRRATHDDLTGLATRPVLRDRLALALARSRRTGGAVAVLFLDIDDLKAVNDSYGHHAGDAVLVEVARRLQDAVRAIDTVARVGGDEFVVVFDGVQDDREAEALRSRVEAVLGSHAIDASGNRVDVSVSSGLALASGDADGEALLRKADASMYAAKGDRRHAPWQVRAPTAPGVGEAASGGPASAHEVAIALTQGLVVPRYWPVATAARRVVGAQATAVWHTRGGLRSAVEFVGCVAGSGVGFSLDLAVLRHAVDDLCGLEAPPERLYVHVSAPFLTRAGVLQVLREVLDRRACPTRSLGLVVRAVDLDDDLTRPDGCLWQLRDAGLRLVAGCTPDGPGLGAAAVPSGLFDEVRLGAAWIERLEQDPDLLDERVAQARELGLDVRLAGVVDEASVERAAGRGVTLFEGRWVASPWPDRSSP